MYENMSDNVLTKINVISQRQNLTNLDVLWNKKHKNYEKV